jgi:hypothetical protein
VKYHLYRRFKAQVLNNVQIPASPATEVNATLDGTTLGVIDNTEYPHGLVVTYFVKAELGGGGLSDKSVEVEITAINDPPVANTDPSANSRYETVRTTPLVVPGPTNWPTLIANDTDADSPDRTLVGRIVILTQPTKGALTNVTPSGGFTYTAVPNRTGFDSFTYKLRGGEWAPNVPFSPDSDPGTANINIKKN